MVGGGPESGEQFALTAGTTLSILGLSALHCSAAYLSERF
jgi:hypothetical protein